MIRGHKNIYSNVDPIVLNAPYICCFQIIIVIYFKERCLRDLTIKYICYQVESGHKGWSLVSA